ncbi:dehydrogenase E1 component-domain-containing protein [Cokeromyces recurvatus]|uniref:dehydrogenase E1 component-domain-containing protein n=1 Tax=Cokeromyces recurvatus TaxID=90255 RepID=UPI00221F0042|nr:dehydrogenase E1 component-domain-containing protein [Cokeromyces recurvatus]KAI7897983.1 dehydrogenase E1 component-domain-containing protein [Cokeromyces recurvatus]
MLKTVAKRFIVRRSNNYAIRNICTTSPARIAEKSPTSASEDETIKITLPDNSFQMYNAEAPSLELETSKKEMLDMYTQMSTIRRLEMASDGLYKGKKIRGFCHLSTGEEAIAVGIEHAITPNDHVITSYRCHGYTFLRGASVKSILAELMGRSAGVSKGKGGSMHMFAHNFYGGNGIVGAQVPLGAGIAFAQQYQGNASTTLALYGDGAANQGQVFEAFNMAKLWNLPIVFICENNKYGMGTSNERSSASIEYYKRGDYIPGIRANGMDIFAVKKAVQWARDWTISGKGPLVMEVTTYRYGGHSMSDPGTTYRTRDEIQQVRSSSDPISHLKKLILEHNIATEAELKDIEKKVKKEVDDAQREAENSPEPDIKEFWTDIYVPNTEPKAIRGCEPTVFHYYS